MPLKIVAQHYGELAFIGARDADESTYTDDLMLYGGRFGAPSESDSIEIFARC